MAANRVNITLGDMQLVQIDMLSELRGTNRSQTIANMISMEYGREVYHERLSSDEMWKRLDERCAQRESEKA